MPSDCWSGYWRLPFPIGCLLSWNSGRPWRVSSSRGSWVTEGAIAFFCPASFLLLFFSSGHSYPSQVRGLPQLFLIRFPFFSGKETLWPLVPRAHACRGWTAGSDQMEKKWSWEGPVTKEKACLPKAIVLENGHLSWLVKQTRSECGPHGCLPPEMISAQKPGLRSLTLEMNFLQKEDCGHRHFIWRVL